MTTRIEATSVEIKPVLHCEIDLDSPTKKNDL